MEHPHSTSSPTSTRWVFLIWVSHYPHARYNGTDFWVNVYRIALLVCGIYVQKSQGERHPIWLETIHSFLPNRMLPSATYGWIVADSPSLCGLKADSEPPEINKLTLMSFPILLSFFAYSLHNFPCWLAAFKVTQKSHAQGWSYVRYVWKYCKDRMPSHTRSRSSSCASLISFQKENFSCPTAFNKRC